MTQSTFTAPDLQELRKTFCDLDTNGLGRLTIAQMQSALESSTNPKLRSLSPQMLDLDLDGIFFLFV